MKTEFRDTAENTRHFYHPYRFYTIHTVFILSIPLLYHLYRFYTIYTMFMPFIPYLKKGKRTHEKIRNQAHYRRDGYIRDT